MKKQKLLIGAFLVFSLASAQAQTANQLGAGVKGGYNFNQFDQTGTAAGGQIGGYVRYSAATFLSVQAEVLYDLQGGGRHSFVRDISSFNPGTQQSGYIVEAIAYSSRSVQLHTVSVPLSVRLSPASSSNMALYFVLGGSFDYVFGAMERHDAIYHFENGNSVLMSDRTENVAGDLGSYQVSAHIGVAFDYILDDGRTITYEMRYRRSFTDINETITATAALTEDLYTTTFSLSIYYPIF